MKAKKGNKVKVDYTGSLEDGTVFDSSTHGDHSHPLEFEVGAGQMIKGFDEAVVGMEKDEEKEITLQPDEAYGMVNPQLIQKVPKAQFPPLPDGQELKEGMMLTLKHPTGQPIPAKIVHISDKEVTLDLNHPLAGKVLKFKIKLLEIQ